MKKVIEEKQMVSGYSIILSNKRAEQKYHEVFKQEFNINLLDYWSMVTGFDLIRFDEEFLKTPQGISTRDYVTKIYGSYVSDILEAIIHESTKQLDSILLENKNNAKKV